MTERTAAPDPALIGGSVAPAGKRLLLVIDHLGSGGAQRQLANLAVQLHRKGHRIEIFVYHPHDFFAGPLAERGITLHRCYKRSRFSTDVLFALRRLVKENQYDGMISFLNTPNFYAEMTKLLLGTSCPTLIVSERISDSPATPFMYRKVLRQLHRLADHVTVNSYHHRHALEGQYAWMRKKISTIYNGVDLDAFYPDPAMRTSTDNLTLLAVAGVSERKNGLRLIQALDIVRTKYRLAPILHWIGAHRMSMPGGKNTCLQWKAELERLNLERQWQWHDPQNDIAPMMRSVDALIHPSYMEGLPNAVCEALASGLPALVSHTQDNPLLVQDGVSGFLFDPYSPESIADAIFRFSELDSAARNRMGAAGRSFAEQRLGLQTLADRYEQLIWNMPAATESL